MRRRNWLELFRKLVDTTDLDYTLNAIMEFIAKSNLDFFGFGTVVTSTYPNPFPITLDPSSLALSVGPGIAYDPTGLPVRIDPGSTTPTSVAIPPLGPGPDPRWDLLVIRYKATGDTLIPSPADPLVNVPLNLHDDFALVVIPGAQTASPAYPAKLPYDVILAGLRLPSGTTNTSTVTVDLGIREVATPQKALNPVFVTEIPTGAIDGTNVVYQLSQTPMTAQSLMLLQDGLVMQPAQYTLSGQTVMLASPLQPGQELWARYLAASPASQNPLSQVVETPSGDVNGSNPNFVLSGRPGSRSSLLVFVDGVIVKPSGWTLIESPTAYTVQFTLGYIPAAGQSVEVSYLVNASTIGSAGSGSSSGGSSPSASSGFKVYGSPSNPSVVDPAAGILVTTDARQKLYVVGSSGGGAESLTANPQIQAGTAVGQELLLRGSSDADYPVLVDGNGVSLNGLCNLTSKQALTLTWDGTVWDETSRRI